MPKTNNAKGITLIALVITIILLLILAGVVIKLTLGGNGILKQAEQSNEQYKISEILEKLELEKADLYAKKNGEIPSVNEYIEHLINKGIITSENVWNIDDNTKHITIEGETFLVEKEESGNIKITHIGKVNSPKIGKIEVTTTTTDSISVKVITSNVKEGQYKYSIKNVTTGETTFTTVATEATDEYTFVGLVENNEYIIQVELITDEGTDIKQTGIIKAEFPKARTITLNKTEINIYTSTTETIIATVLPEEALDRTVTWKSSDENVITVDNTGKVTAIGEGTATIIVTSNEVNTVTATCKVTVTTPPPPTASVGSSTHSAKALSYTWEELNNVAKVISDNYGKITNNTAEVNVSVYGKSYTLGIGDTKTLNGKKVRILGFNHDTLTNKGAYGGTNTYAGITFDYVDALTTWKYTTGAWNAVGIRSTLNSTIYNGLENKKYIKQVNKNYIPTHDVASLSTTADYLWLLSECEVRKTRSEAVVADGNRYKFFSVAGEARTTRWILRTLRKNYIRNEMTGLEANGSGYWAGVGQSVYIYPGFCI